MIEKILLLLLDAVFWLVAPAAILRFYMQLLSVSFRNPVGQFVRALTDWIVLPLRRIFKGAGYDWASLIAAYFFELVYTCLKVLIVAGVAPFTSAPGVAAILISSVFGLVITALVVVVLLLFVYAISSWFARGESPVADMLGRLVMPWLAPIRRRMPLVGGIDLSPMVLSLLLIIAIYILQGLMAQIAGVVGGLLR